MATDEQRQFRNRCTHTIGVVVFDGNRRVGRPVRPGESVWLTPDEIDATTRAPRNPANSPFAGGTGPEGEGPALEEVAGQDRPLPPEVPPPAPKAPEEVGAAVEPQGAAAEGQHAPGEEVGDPQAPSKTGEPGPDSTPDSKTAKPDTRVGLGGVRTAEPDLKSEL